jgi:hypothetical protein
MQISTAIFDDKVRRRQEVQEVLVVLHPEGLQRTLN